jgi:hypothetical protein
MRRIILMLALAGTTLAFTTTAAAQEHGPRGSVGVGAAIMLDGPGGAAFVYDAGPWHMDAMLGLISNGETIFGVGGRFWYHIHSAPSADFSLGGGMGVTSGDNFTVIDLEAGAHIRAFIVSNVSIGASVGISIAAADGDGFILAGQLIGATNIIYYF